MTLKDWKKITHSNGSLVFKKGDKYIHVMKSHNGWFVFSESLGFHPLKDFIKKDFKTKSPAIAYAKAYIKTH